MSRFSMRQTLGKLVFQPFKAIKDSTPFKASEILKPLKIVCQNYIPKLKTHLADHRHLTIGREPTPPHIPGTYL